MIDKYLNQGDWIELKTTPEGTEKIFLKPLTIEYMPKFLKLIRMFKDMKEGDNPLEHMTDESSQTISDLIYATLKRSLPEEKDEDLKLMGMQYFFPLFMKMMDI